jgi:hypothetical protein
MANISFRIRQPPAGELYVKASGFTEQAGGLPIIVTSRRLATVRTANTLFSYSSILYSASEF